MPYVAASGPNRSASVSWRSSPSSRITTRGQSAFGDRIDGSLPGRACPRGGRRLSVAAGNSAALHGGGIRGGAALPFLLRLRRTWAKPCAKDAVWSSPSSPSSKDPGMPDTIPIADVRSFSAKLAQDDTQRRYSPRVACIYCRVLGVRHAEYRTTAHKHTVRRALRDRRRCRGRGAVGTQASRARC